jgi:hypothetical protein
MYGSHFCVSGGWIYDVRNMRYSFAEAFLTSECAVHMKTDEDSHTTVYVI